MSLPGSSRCHYNAVTRLRHVSDQSMRVCDQEHVDAQFESQASGVVGAQLGRTASVRTGNIAVLAPNCSQLFAIPELHLDTQWQDNMQLVPERAVQAHRGIKVFLNARRR